MLYFAYGSNMNHKRMSRRCPNASYVGNATLDGFKFVYDESTKGQNFANISQAEGNIVWGALFEISDGDLVNLDSYEGYPGTYQRKSFEVKTPDGKAVEALVYYRNGRRPGKPSEKYRSIVKDGAKDCGLPEDYIAKL